MARHTDDMNDDVLRGIAEDEANGVLHDYDGEGVASPGYFISEELKARGWSVRDLAHRMGGDAGENELVVGLLMHVEDRNLLLDAETAAQLGKAFGTSAELWTNLDRSWRLGAHPI